MEAHREEITLHKAAKAAFDEAGMKKLPKVKELDTEYAELLIKKKAAYPDYRKARDEMQELMKAQKNVELFFAEDKSNLRPQHTDKRIPSRTLPIVEVSSAAFLYIGQQFLTVFYGRVSENQSVINAARASLLTSCDIVSAHLSA